MRQTRAGLLGRGAVAIAGAAGLGWMGAPVASADGRRHRHHHRAGDPKPIPGGFDQTFTPVPSDPFIHILPPAIGFEMSTITDFNGVIAAGEIQGSAHGSDGTTYGFDCDMRFMRGVYVDEQGELGEASFGFV
jgi:hypothetical protein